VSINKSNYFHLRKDVTSQISLTSWAFPLGNESVVIVLILLILIQLWCAWQDTCRKIWRHSYQASMLNLIMIFMIQVVSRKMEKVLQDNYGLNDWCLFDIIHCHNFTAATYLYVWINKSKVQINRLNNACVKLIVHAYCYYVHYVKFIQCMKIQHLMQRASQTCMLCHIIM